MIQSTLVFIILFITPSIVVKGLKKFKGLQFFGPVFYCYLLGIILTNILTFLEFPISKEIQSIISNLSQGFVLIALVQMILSTHFYELIKLARKGIIAFIAAVVSVFSSSVIVFKILPLIIPSLSLLDLKHLISMSVGVYTGGTANMAVLSQSLKVNPELFLHTYTSDLIISGILLMLLMNFIPWVFGKILIKFNFSQFKEDEETLSFENTAHLFPYPEAYHLKLKNIFSKYLFTILILALSLGVSWIISQTFGLSLDQIALLTITTTAIGLSLVFKSSFENKNEYFILGDYNLLIFCFSMGTLANLNQLQNIPLWIMMALSGVIFLSVLFHLALSFILKIDRDISIITLTASIFGPPFVICTSQALRNKFIITTGITTGLIGMILGTYLGLLFFNLF